MGLDRNNSSARQQAEEIEAAEVAEQKATPLGSNPVVGSSTAH